MLIYCTIFWKIVLAGFTLFGKFLRNKSEILPVATWSKLVCQILNNCQNELVILSPSKGQESDLHFILHIQSELSEQTVWQLAKKHDCRWHHYRAIIVAKIHSLTRILLLIMSISRQMTLTRLLIFVANYSFIIA